MTFLRVASVILLCPLLCLASGNVTITVNDHLDCDGQLYTGIVNYINIHIANTAPLTAIAMGFEFTTYGTTVDWIETGSVTGCFGDCYVEEGCRAIGAFDLGGKQEVKRSFDGSFPDSILFGGAALSNLLPAGTLSDVVYRLAVFIPEGAPAGQICIDNVFIPPAGSWTFDEGTGGYAPDYFGCVNASEVNPDCPAVCFDVVERICGDVNDDGMVTIADQGFFLDYLLNSGPAPCPLETADFNGDCIVSIADSTYLAQFLFAAGPAPVCSCEFVTAVCDTCEAQYPGDFDNNGSILANDLGALVQYICNGGPAPTVPANADPDGDCDSDSADIAYLSNYLFFSGPPPVDCTCENPVLGSCALPLNLCQNSTTDPVFLICPGGDAPFKVYLKDENGDPVVGDSSVYLVFDGCSGVVPCPPAISLENLYPSAPSDTNGVLTFFFAGGGCNTACSLSVRSICGEIAKVPVRSFDINGDLGVSVGFDFDFSECNNYNGTPGIQFADQIAFYGHVGHYCGLGPCERFQASFYLEPGYNLAPGQQVSLNLVLQNNNFDACNIGFIGFFSSGFGTGGGQQLIQNYPYNQSLPPGAVDTVVVTYTVPGIGHGCLDIEFLTSCCTTTVALQQCAQSTWHCAADAGLCYEVNIKLDGPPVFNIVVPDDFLPPGWFLQEMHVPSLPVLALDSIVYRICTPEEGQLGDDAHVPVEVWYDVGGFDIQIFESQVFITPRSGDCDGNCIISISDVVYIIQYIFAGGPEPIPYEAGDVDCNGIVNISDAVVLINFIFAGGPPPCIP